MRVATLKFELEETPISDDFMLYRRTVMITFGGFRVAEIKDPSEHHLSTDIRGSEDEAIADIIAPYLKRIFTPNN